MGSSVIIARVTGEKGIKDARYVLVQSLFMSILIGVSIAFLGFVFSNQIIITFFGAADFKVMSLARTYYKIVCLGMPFL